MLRAVQEAVDPSSAAEILAGQWHKIALEAFCFLDDVATLSVSDRTAGYRTAAAFFELVWTSEPHAVSLSWWPYGKETELLFHVGDDPWVSSHSFDAYFSGEPIHQTLRTSDVMREVLPEGSPVFGPGGVGVGLLVVGQG